MKTIAILAALSLLSTAASAEILLDLDFASSDDLTGWTAIANATPANVTFLDAVGNPAGAIGFNALNTTIAGQAYIFQLSTPIDLAGNTEVTLDFDGLITSNLIGSALHMGVTFAGPAGINQHFDRFDVQNQLNSSTFTPLSFTFDSLPTGADTLVLQFNLAVGAFEGAGGSVALDNITAYTPVPEPATTAGLASGVAGLATLMLRRRKRQ